MLLWHVMAAWLVMPGWRHASLHAALLFPCSPSLPASLQHRAAEQRLLLTQGAQQVRDVQVRVHVLERRAQLAFFPCFHLEYELGEDFNAHGERIPARYEAIISGTGKHCVLADSRLRCCCSSMKHPSGSTHQPLLLQWRAVWRARGTTAPNGQAAASCWRRWA